MKKAMTVLGLGAAAVAFSVSNANAMEQQAQTTTGINLRQDPSATSNKVSELQAGSNVTIKERKNGWTKVQTEDGQSGWVSGYYVTSDEDAIDSQDKEVNANLSNEAVDTKSNSVKQAINQKQSEVNKNVVKSVDTEVKDNKSFDKNNVKTNGVKQNTVTQDKNVVSKEAVNSNAKLKKTSYLNVRIGPSTSNSVSSVIYKGEMFKVVDRAANGWYKVVLNDGTVGWASNKYIDLTNEVDNTNIQNFTKKSGKNNKTEVNSSNSDSALSGNYGRVNNAAGLNVRSGAGSKSSVISTLKNNDIINIIGEENGWYKIKLDNGQVGYVGSTLVAKASASEVSSSRKNYIEVSDKKVDSSIKESSKTVYSGENSGAKVVETAESLLGTPYSWGGTSPSGFDCSGFTQYVYKNALGVDLPRVSRDQANYGSAVSVSSAKAGDLLYFDTVGSGRTSHVGIYIGSGKFIHASGTASNPDCVKVSSLSENWVNCLGARRVQ